MNYLTLRYEFHIFFSPQDADPANRGSNRATVYLVDGVTGGLVEAVQHRRVSGTIHAVHSENWMVSSPITQYLQALTRTADVNVFLLFSSVWFGLSGVHGVQRQVPPPRGRVSGAVRRTVPAERHGLLVLRRTSHAPCHGEASLHPAHRSHVS